MMHNTIATMATAGGVSILTAMGFFAGVGGTDVIQTATTPPPPRAIIANDLVWDWNTYKIGQDLIVQNGPVLGDWAASFWRDGVRLCGSGGRADYESRTAGNVKWMSPDVWTGDECPAIQPGDYARVVWEWKAEDGSVKSASVQKFVIPEKTE